nr:protein FAM107A [Pelodiscus sinensis]|eukprot:XP_006126855.1 protein FAM107A [Pelodiscus sinensis]
MSQRVEDQVRVPPGATGLYRAMLVKSASMYSEIQRERPEVRNFMAHPDYIDGNPDLIKPKKLLNPVKASRSHQELHRELLMNHKRRQQRLDQLEREHEKEEEHAPEFIKVKENLRRTSVPAGDEKAA